MLRSMKVKNNVANRGMSVKARKPISHGEMKIVPFFNSLLASGERFLNDLREGNEFRKLESCSNIGISFL
jgi:hypothetical protein